MIADRDWESIGVHSLNASPDYWVSRRAIRFYNVHVPIGEGVLRVGEIPPMHGHSRVYVFDQNGFQWGEFMQTPRCGVRR